MDRFEGISLDTTLVRDHLSDAELEGYREPVAAVARDLETGVCPGADFLGWLDLPERIEAADIQALEAEAERIREQADVLVVVGIGGSYLGARAVLAALGRDGAEGDGPEVLFAGTGLCAETLHRTLARIADRRFHVCVISKSGTTLEPAVAFRFLRTELESRYGKDAGRFITAVTDAARGALRRMADDGGWRSFVIPDDVGGRFSVLTPVGLLPLAVAGVDVSALVDGAARMRRVCRNEDLLANPAHLYAACRHGLYEKGFTTEILSTFHGDLQLLQEWWKQLFGESEGKQGRGIFPASAVFTTDLHSLGQYVQDGRRNLQETFLCVRESRPGLVVPADPGGGGHDGLGYLEGRPLDRINWTAYQGTRKAHHDGGVPSLGLEVDRLDAGTIGGLIYLFEKAVAVGGLLLGVNPFDQPGVEAYKKEVFRLLGKP